MIPPLKFTAADADRAFEQWGCNCGPGAIAAICGLSLDEVRPMLGDFEAKRYTNPTLMWQILDGVKARNWSVRRDKAWPAFGLCRIQWEGPWTEPEVHPKARYRFTHWVGACARNPENIGIFDINAIANGTGWCSLADWEGTIVPFILDNCVPRANGRWHITHSVEVPE